MTHISFCAKLAEQLISENLQGTCLAGSLASKHASARTAIQKPSAVHLLGTYLIRRILKKKIKKKEFRDQSKAHSRERLCSLQKVRCW